MRRVILAAGCLIPSLLLAASPGEWRISADGFDPTETPKLTSTAGETAWVAFRDREGRLMVRRPDSAAEALTTPPRNASGIALEAFGEHLYAAWLESRRGVPPAVVLRALDETGGWSTVQTLDTASRPLPRIRLTGDAEGQVAAVWLGDAPDSGASVQSAGQTSPNYHLYGRRSVDGGKTWGDVRRLTAGYDGGFWPAVTMAGGRAHVFADARRDGKTYLVHARGDDAAGWTPAESIGEAGSVLLIDAAEVRGQPLVVWFGAHGDEYRLESAVREGSEWKTYCFPGSADYDIGSMDLASHGDRLYLVFSARPADQSVQPRKNHVYFSRSLDGGLSWEPIRPLRHYPFEQTQDNFPQLAVDEKGTLAVAWNDYRNIRGDLYYNVSTDGGARWLEQDRPLDPPGVTEDVLFPFVHNLAAAHGAFYLLSARYRDDGLGLADLYLHAVPAEPVARVEDRLSDQGSPEKRRLLVESVSTFWNALIKRDYGTAYALFDPYFRRRMRQDDYIAQSGRVKHRSFDIRDLRIEGNVAQVAVGFVYEIPTFKMPRGGTYVRPPTPTAVTETWIFIDGQWHKEYHNDIGDFSFTRY